MKRREFIKSMAAAAALPAFLGEQIMAEPEFKNLRAGMLRPADTPLDGITGFTWNCIDGRGGMIEFPPDAFIVGEEFSVTVDWADPPILPVIGAEITPDIFDWAPEASTIKLWRGETLIYQIVAPGAVEMVFLHPLRPLRVSLNIDEEEDERDELCDADLWVDEWL